MKTAGVIFQVNQAVAVRLWLSTVELFWIPHVNSVSNSKKSSVNHGHRDQLKMALLSSINFNKLVTILTDLYGVDFNSIHIYSQNRFPIDELQLV